MIMSLKQREIKFKPRIKLNQNICYIALKKKRLWKAIYLFVCFVLNFLFFWPSRMPCLSSRKNWGCWSKKRSKRVLTMRVPPQWRSQVTPLRENYLVKRTPLEANIRAASERRREWRGWGWKKGNPSLEHSVAAHLACYKWRALARVRPH